MLIGNYSFDIISKLGAGSFGCVWAAKCELLESVAVKEITCHTPDARDDAQREGNLLQHLAQQLPSAVAKQIPALYAREVVSTSPGRWQVCLAMRRLPGVPVSKFLKGLQCAKRSADAEFTCDRLVRDCSVARDFLSQLAGAFEHISKFVYHRDINPGNVLVEEQASGPRFAVIDFGLATDAVSWRADVLSPNESRQVGLQRLHRCRVVGNGCYWPTSSWLAFTHGADVLSRDPEMRLEFAECSDTHPTGIVALQLLLGSLPHCRDHPEASRNDSLVSKIADLQQAWVRYHHQTTSTWSRILSAANGGGMELLRSSLACVNFHKSVQKDLQTLQAALKETLQACEKSPPDQDLSKVAVPLEAISKMISTGQKSHHSPDWRMIKLSVRDSSVSRVESMTGFNVKGGSAAVRDTSVPSRCAGNNFCAGTGHGDRGNEGTSFGSTCQGIDSSGTRGGTHKGGSIGGRRRSSSNTRASAAVGYRCPGIFLATSPLDCTNNNFKMLGTCTPSTATPPLSPVPQSVLTDESI
jgi:serine/threonine protein kinase